jgi:hypothetical protein
MGACKSKSKESSHHNHKHAVKADGMEQAKAEVKTAEANKNVISPNVAIVKSQPVVQEVVNSVSQTPALPKVISHKIQFVNGNSTWHEGTFQSDRTLSSIIAEFNSRFKGREFDYLLVEKDNKRDITKLIGNPLNKILPADSGSYQIELSYAGLSLAEDARTAYINSFKFLAAPKYESSPFEMVIFNILESLPINHIFNEENHKILSNFSNFSAYCNGANKIFFSGGEIKNSEEYSNMFVEIDLLNLENVKILPVLNQARSWHSMIFVPPKFIFIVGGKNTKSVELYDMEKKTISIDSNLNEYRGEAPLSLVNNTYLYVFGGFTYNDKHPKSFERCNLKMKNRVWEIVNLKNPEIFEPSFFSLAYGRGNSIILLGDRENANYINKSYSYVLNENGEDQLQPYEPHRAEEPYINSEKFFIPIDPFKSILLPLYNSEVIKLLIFDSGTDKGVLTMQKSEIIETAEDESRNIQGFNPSNKMNNQFDSQMIIGQKSQANPT